MYEVFIDNCIIEFTEKHIKKGLLANEQLFFIDKSSKSNIDAISHLIGVYTKFIVQVTDLETGIRDFFPGYEFRETAGGIVQRKKKYLFIERNGVWDLPKGHVEKGETYEETAVREIEEECGIQNAKISHFLGVTYHTYLYKGNNILKKNHWFSLSYSGPKETKGQEEEGITQVVWLKRKEWSKVRKLTYPSIEAVLNLYEKVNQ